MQQCVKVWHVGLIDYLKALKLQKHLFNLHLNGGKIPNTLLCVEHPPVYTTGIRTKGYSLEEEIKLKNLGADFYRTDRGGLITFHGPGQLIVYPIINLQLFHIGIRLYIERIENIIINICKEFGIKANTSPHTGVWINNNKVCAIGVHASRYITTHGLALNCFTDLTWFSHIIPCGIPDKGVTSLSKELNRQISIEETVPLFLNYFSKEFNCKIIDFPLTLSKQIFSTL